MSKVKDFPVITIRVQPNCGHTHVLWAIETMDGTRANGVAFSPADAMRDATAFVEAMSMPRLVGHFKGRELRVVK